MGDTGSSPSLKKITHFRRRHFFVKRKLQVHFAASASLFILISTISIWVVMNWIFSRDLSDGMVGSKLGTEFIFRSNCMILILILADAIAKFFYCQFIFHILWPVPSSTSSAY